MLQSTTDTNAHIGFGSSMRTETARHQMRMSLGVVAVLALAIGLCMAGLAPRSGWSDAGLRVVSAASPYPVEHVSLDETVPRGG